MRRLEIATVDPSCVNPNFGYPAMAEAISLALFQWQLGSCAGNRGKEKCLSISIESVAF